MKTTLTIIIAITILSMTIQFAIQETKAETIEDLIIDGKNETRNENFEVKNIIVKNNGTLTLKNLTAKINGNIFIEANSSLILNSINIIMNSKNKEINNSGNLIILGKENKITSPNNYTFKIYGSAEIYFVTIENTTRGIEVYSSSVNITKTIIQKNQLFGIFIDGVNPKITDSVIEENNIGIFSRNSAPTINNCTVKENSRGIHLENSTTIIEKSKILNNKEAGVFIDKQSNPEFKNNSVENNNYGFRFLREANSSFKIVNSKFYGNGDAVYFDGDSNSNPTFLNTTINSEAGINPTPPPFVFDDSSSSAIISWYLKIKVKNWQSLKEIPRIILKDKYGNELYNNSGEETTLIEYKEKIENRNVFYNPHKIFIKIGNIEINETINLECYKEEIIDIKSYFGVIKGNVKLEGKNDNYGVLIELIKDGKIIETRKTDNSGNYIFEFISPGSYNISASYLNYSTKWKEINVSAGKEVWWNLTLEKEKNKIEKDKIDIMKNTLIFLPILLLIITIVVYYYASKNKKILKEMKEKKKKH